MKIEPLDFTIFGKNKGYASLPYKSLVGVIRHAAFVSLALLR